MQLTTGLQWALSTSSASFGTWFLRVLILLLIVVLIIRNIRIVPQATSFIIERLGVYQTTWTAGIRFKIPIIERVSKVVSLKEKVIDFPPQAVITKDHVTIQIDAVFYYQIIDPRLYAYSIENPLMAIENLMATTLRSVIGDMELNEVFALREQINERLHEAMDEATRSWGIETKRVLVKNMIPPKDILIAMENQMKAERQKQENILLAEGEKTAAILRAEAMRETAIREAEGKAEAMIKIQEASVRSLKMLKEAGINQSVLAMKSLETLGQLADGKATKIIIPSDIQNMAGLAVSLSEWVHDDGKPVESD